MDQYTHPAAERLFPVALLTLSGGLQDAYTYLRRGKVFANAQTGNIVLLGQSLFDGDWGRAARYLLPVLAFALGVAAAEAIRVRRPRWQRRVLLWEILLLFLVGFIPHSLDQLANALVSFSCAMQVQAFRKVEGFVFASTMCIGNLRSGMEALCAYLRRPAAWLRSCWTCPPSGCPASCWLWAFGRCPGQNRGGVHFLCRFSGIPFPIPDSSPPGC